MNSPPFFQLPRQDKGLTLIELMVTISILAILMALAVPSFQSMIASSNLTTTTNDLVATFAQARSDAIRRGKRVTVCMSADSLECTTTGAWSQGWIMFHDDVHTGTDAAVGSDKTVIKAASSALTNNLMIKTTNGMFYVSYGADGQSKQMNGAPGFGTIRICSDSSALTDDTRSRDIVINFAGRVNVTKETGIASSCPAPT